MEEFPKIEEIALRDDGSLIICSQDWLNDIAESYIENITNEEWYTICKIANMNGIHASYKLKKEK